MQMVENLLRQGKALSSNPSIDCQSKKKKKVTNQLEFLGQIPERRGIKRGRSNKRTW
jgi:hypothetical protein